MIQITLDLKSKSDAELKQFSANHIAKMTGNASFPTPVPSGPAFQTLHDAFSTALAASDAADNAAKQATSAKNIARANLETGLTQRGRNIEGTPGLTEPMLLSAGFSAKSARTPIGVVAQVTNLALTAGDNEGEVDAQWDAVRGAKSYEVQWSLDPITPTSWHAATGAPKSKTALLGLTSGQKIWVRVRALGSAGPGAWSDPATKIVP